MGEKKKKFTQRFYTLIIFGSEHIKKPCRALFPSIASSSSEHWGTLLSAGLQLEPGLSWLLSAPLLSGLPRWFPRPAHAFVRGVECRAVLLGSASPKSGDDEPGGPVRGARDLPLRSY